MTTDMFMSALGVLLGLLFVFAVVGDWLLRRKE